MNKEIKNKILTHINCYKFDNMYVFYKNDRDLSNPCLRIDSNPDAYSPHMYYNHHWNRMTFEEWFIYYFKNDETT